MKCPDEAQTYSHAYWLYSPNVVKDDNPNLQPSEYLRWHVSLRRERKLLKQYPALPEMIQLTTPHPPDTSSQGQDDTGTIFPPFHPCEAINHYLIDKPERTNDTTTPESWPFNYTHDLQPAFLPSCLLSADDIYSSNKVFRPITNHVRP